MTRRLALLRGSYFLAAWPLLGKAPALSVRGTLTRSSDGKPALQPSGQELILLTGDHDTLGVLNDKRLWGTDFEALGHFTAPGHFEIDGIYTRSMFVHKDGKRLLITYWCDVCSIRTYTPGNCVCCQKYTDLDLRENDDE